MPSEAWSLLTPEQKQEMEWLAARISAHYMRRGQVVTPQQQAAMRREQLGLSTLAPSSIARGRHIADITSPQMATVSPPTAPTMAASAPSIALQDCLVVDDMPRPSRLDRIYWKIMDDPEFKHLRDFAEFVPGDGPWPNPKAMLIGEAPGADEDRLKRPFVGRCGNFLDGKMWEAGLKRSDVFVTNVVKFRPPKNRTPTQEEIENAIPHLRREVVTVLPEGGVIILLGAVPLNVVDQTLRISQVRGKVVERGKWMFVPMYHPSYVMRKRKEVLEQYTADWKLIKELVS